MPRGHPDWNVNVDWYAFFDIDSAELAARLGSVATYNRSGRVVHIDKCTHDPVTFELPRFGTGAAVVLDSSKSFRHQASLKLIAGSDSIGRAGISKNLPVISLSKHGLEVTWSPTSGGFIVALSLDYFDGTNNYSYTIRCNLDDQKLYYFNSAGSYVEFANIFDIAAKPAYWHVSKLVIDLVRFEYVAYHLDEMKYDLSEVDGRVSTDGSTPHIQARVYHQGEPSGNPYIHVNDFIFTMDEP